MNIIKDTIYLIPSNERTSFILDADWNDKHGLLLVKENKRKHEVLINGMQIPTEVKTKYPLIRWINKSHFVLIDTRCKGRNHNAFIINTNGELTHSFHCGDAISDVQVNKEGIWVGYFDEGIYGEGISTEGLVFFSLDGKPVKRYHSELKGDKLSIHDCYALCKGKGTSIWMYAYGDSELTHWDVTNNQLKTYETPETCTSPKGICIRGNYAYFHASFDYPDNLYVLEIGKSEAKFISKVKGNLRGLSPREKNHFINIDEKEVSVFYIENSGESYK